MYLGIDFLVTPELNPLVVEVNVGLPGGAQEHDLTSLVHTGRPSGVFSRIEKVSHEVYGKPFREYLQSLPWLNSLKPLKIWMDGEGPFPQAFHPALRLEDKWVQYQILSSRVPMPETMVCDPSDISEAGRFLSRKGRLVAKRRLGRGGRDFKLIDSIGDLAGETAGPYGRLFQEWVDSRVASYVFSIRSIAFGGEPICGYANLASRTVSNHGVLTFIESGSRLGLSVDEFAVRPFNQRSWEAEIWFGRDEPTYLRHNLYEDEVAEAALVVPRDVWAAIQDISVKIERFYESLELAALPRAFFE